MGCILFQWTDIFQGKRHLELPVWALYFDWGEDVEFLIREIDRSVEKI